MLSSPFTSDAICSRIHRGTFAKYQHLVDVLPGVGFGREQVQDLEDSINTVPCDLLVTGMPLDLSQMVNAKRPMARVTYGMDSSTAVALCRGVDAFLGGLERRWGT